MKKENNGFSPEKEKNFLGRLVSGKRKECLGQELKTQLAEDFGLVKFTLRYKFDENGKIVDLISGESIVELTARGENSEETESLKKIEEALKNDPQKTWIHFSPKNEELGYGQNSVDFLRVIRDEIVWNRIVIEDCFEEMNKVRSILSGQEEVKDKKEILKSPIGVNLKLAEIFNFFKLSEAKYFDDFNYIRRVVDNCLGNFDDEFGENLFKEKDLIYRLYSVCFNALKSKDGEIIGRGVMENYMYGVLRETRIEKSFGCSVTTTVGAFGEKIGYYISSDGQVHHGEIPPDYKECKQCGCWYSGEKCPFC